MNYERIVKLGVQQDGEQVGTNSYFLIFYSYLEGDCET